MDIKCNFYSLMWDGLRFIRLHNIWLEIFVRGGDTLIRGFVEAGWGRSLQNMCTKYFWLDGGEGGCTLGLCLG